MLPIADYHMHTPLCGHAVGEPSLYARQALKLGLKEIGFSDHAPLVSHDDPTITMSRDQLSLYYRMCEDVREQFKDRLVIKIGLEADFIPGYEDKTKAILDDYPYDYVIGSVHFIQGWGFDNPEELKGWDKQEINAVYRDYYQVLRQCACSGMYNIMGHVDLVKKFGHRSSIDLTDEIRKTAAAFKEAGVAVEINTSGLRKPVHEIYPSLTDLRIYCEAGVPVTFGSDAHEPTDVGRDYDQALRLAREAGYTEYVLFRNRRIERTVKL